MTTALDVHVAAYQGQNPYDFDNQILLNWYPQRILTRSQGAQSLLELGLGHGFATNQFSGIFERHLVLDGSAAVIENFHKSFPTCHSEIVETYFENFETEEKFDIVVMGFILEHVDDPLQIMSKFKNYLAPGGKLFLAVPNAEVLNRRLGHLAGMLPDMQTLSPNDVLLGHKRYYTVNSLSSDVDRAGFKIDKLEGIYLKPFTTAQMVSLDLPPSVIQALCEVGIDYPELSCGIFAEISAK